MLAQNANTCMRQAVNGGRTDTEIIEQSTAFSFLRLDNDTVNFGEIDLVEMENGFYFAFECVLRLSSPTP